MGRLRDHARNLADQILKRGKEKLIEKGKEALKKAKDHVINKIKDRVKKHGGTIASHTKRILSGSKTHAAKRDYSKDLHAKLSALSYETDPVKLQREARRLGYDVDMELSSPNHVVFQHRKNKTATIAYRGTNPNNKDDLAADVHIGTGSRRHQRFKDALHVAKRTQQKYGSANVDVTGHSLGGTQALHVHEILGVNARVYNPGSSPTNQTFKQHSKGKAEIVRHEDDVVSLGYAPYATETYKTSDDLEVPDLLKAHNIPGQ